MVAISVGIIQAPPLLYSQKSGLSFSHDSKDELEEPRPKLNSDLIFPPHYFESTVVMKKIERLPKDK
jgi:hypothetical protein